MKLVALFSDRGGAQRKEELWDFLIGSWKPCERTAKNLRGIHIDLPPFDQRRLRLQMPVGMTLNYRLLRLE
jgi:hypothetical protein